MKRILAVTTASFALVALAACSGNSASSSPSPTNPTGIPTGGVIDLKAVCKNAETTVKAAENALNQLVKELDGATQTELDFVAADLNAAAALMPSSMATTAEALKKSAASLTGTGTGIGAKVQAAGSELTNAEKMIQQDCPATIG